MANIVARFYYALARRKFFAYVLLFLLLLLYFSFLNYSTFFADPDSFYHAKIIKLISSEGIIKNFVSLPYTTLNENYIDHHLLYHLLLVPFAYFFPPLWVVKLAAIFFAALFILIFQIILDKLKIRYSLIYTLILLSAYLFVFRLNLAKAPSLSLIFLLLGLYFIWRKSAKFNLALFVLSFFYVWLYGGFVILPCLTIFFVLTRGVYGWYDVVNQRKTSCPKHPLLNMLKTIFSPANLKPFFIVFFGNLSGLIINPYFPANLKFYWQQTFQIVFVNFKNIIAVGSEWYGYAPITLIYQEIFVFLILLFALIIFFANFPKQKQNNYFLFMVTAIFLFLSFRAKRHVEYFAPLAVLFSASVISDYLAINKFDIKNIAAKITNLFLKYQKIFLLTVFLIIIYLPLLFTLNFFGLRAALNQPFAFDQLKRESSYLLNNSHAGDIIFHDEWSDWPMLFYHNSANRYILGLDPTFLYLASKDKYWLWYNLSSGAIKSNVCVKAKNEFKAAYVLVRKTNASFINNIELDQTCHFAFEGDFAKIYAIN